MRRLLSVILAITMVLSTVAFAAPSVVTITDTAEETVWEGDEAVAELMAAKTLTRGKNMATGTADAFDGDTYTDLSWLTKGASDTTLEVIDDPTGVKDKVLAMTLPAGCSTGYPNFTLDFGGDLDTDIGHTYVYIAFDYQKYVSDVSGYISNKSFWMLNTYSSAGDFAPINFDIDANDGWVHYGKLLDYSVNQKGYDIDSEDNTYYDNHDINKKMIIQFGLTQTNTVPVQMLFDNFMVVPAYKVTYNDADGNMLSEEYVAVDEEGKVLTSLTPETVLKNGIVYSGWSLTQGGSAVESVELGTEDIVLYATKTVDAFTGATITFDKKLTKAGATATATVNLIGNPDFDLSQATWSVADTDIATVSYDKDKGIATVKAISAGKTEITFTYGGYSVTDSLTVATEPVVAENVTSGSEISEFTECDLDVYEYITFNVTNTSGADAIVNVTLNNADTDIDIGINFADYDIVVPAGATNMDVYFDASEDAYWTGEGNTVVATAGSGVTVNNAKLWAELRVEDGVELVSDINLISETGASIVVTAQTTCDLEGVFGNEYTLAVNVTNNCATAEVSGNTVTVTGKTGSGSVIITATSKTDSSITATKEILVNVIEGRGIGYKWDFNDAANPGFTSSYRYTGTEFTGTTADVRAVYATLPGGESAIPVELSTGTVDGKSVTIVKETTYGTITSAVQDGVFKVTEYPYLVIKARTDAPEATGHRLGIYMMYSDHAWGEDKTKLTPDVTLTNEWKLYAIDASESAAFAEEDSGVTGQTFKQMMFSTGQYSTISSEILTGSDGSTYYIEGDVQYSPDNNIEIDEMYFANYDPTKIMYAVSLKADKTSIDGDGVITLTPEVFGSDVVVNDDVNYTVGDTTMASVFKNSDGTATVTPLKDGTVTITATSVMDETASTSIVLTFANIPTRTVAYDLKLMLIGNSYLEHAYLATADKDLYNGFINKNDTPRGMAATSPELDYYSRLCYYLQNGFNATFTAKKQGGAVIEQAWKQGLASGTPTDLTGWDKDVSEAAMKNAAAGIIDYMQREQPNLITIQLSENAAHAYDVSAEWFYDVVFKMIDDNRPENSVVVIISPMGTNASSRTQQVVGAKYGFHWADNTWIGDDYGWGEDNKYLAYWQYPDYTNSAVVEFRSHPGDLGMEEIAKSAYALFEQYIPTTIPANLVTVPESMTISGNDTITNAGGTTQLTVNVEPASSTPDVYWSVDNEYIASVDENGLVTALLNGTVTVKAVSAYDESVVATKTVTITGQTQHYTLTYAAGTDDEVDGIPESFDYAAGTYTIPALVAPPERNGYKFLGWSETEGGAVVETVEMTSDKTVYAVWEFADSWTFDKDGDLEGILVGGFNTKVEGGVMTTISYDGIAVGFSDNTLLLNADLYNKFAANISMSTVNDGDYFTLTLTTTAGEKTYTANTLVGANDYYFDISDAEGMITGFNLVTSNDADGVGMTVDYAKFIKTELKEDKTYETLDVSSDTILESGDNLITIGTASFANDATLTLGAGSYVIGDITGTANIKASPNANIIVTGNVKPDGYVEIDIGTKTGTRYAEVNGNQYKISEDDTNTKYGIIVGDENLLVEIVDVTDISDPTAIITRYFLVNAAETTYEELPMGNYMSNYGNRDLRVPDDQVPSTGIRFKAKVTTDSKKAAEYTITEYGYIIALEEVINNNGGQLNFDLTRADGNKAYATGKAYIKGEVDKVFDSSTDGIHIFTSVLYGCAPENYGRRLVVKTYTNVTVNGEDYVVYGEPMVESFYSMAKELQGSTELSDEAKAIVDAIVAEGEDFDNESGLPGDDLWN